MNRRRFLKSASGLFVPITFGIACRSVAQQIWWNAVEANQAPPAAGGGGYNQPDILGWKCNEGSGTSVADSSSNGTPRACTLSASTFWATGFPNGSTNYLAPNGTSQKGDSAAAINMPATNKLTVEFRINQANYATATRQFYIDYLDGNSNTFAIFDETTGNGFPSGAITLWVFDNSVNRGSYYIVPPSAGAWHHIAWVIDNSAANAPVAYIDGSSVTVNLNNELRTTFANFGSRVLTICSQNGGALWSGAATKDIRIWNGLRTAGNIASDATNYP